MTSSYRPSPFTSHPTVVMPETQSDPPLPSQPQAKQKPAVRYGLYVALVLAIVYAVYTWTR